MVILKISSPIIWYFLWFLEKLLIIIILYRSNQKYYDIIIYSKYNTSCTFYSKVGCVFPLVISPEFRMVQHRNDDHRADAPHFTFSRQMTNTLSFIWRIVTYVTAALVSCVSCVNVAQLQNASNVVGIKKRIFWLLVFADFFLNSNFQNLILRTIPKVLQY